MKPFRALLWFVLILNGAVRLSAAATEFGDAIIGDGVKPVLSVQSVSGTPASVPHLGILGERQAQLSVGDVNLSQGNLQLTESDVNLPGKNGLNVVIQRSYDSSRYRSKPEIRPINTTADPNQLPHYLWGAYAGNGWSFNVGMRAFYVMATPEKRKIIIEHDGQMDQYEYRKDSDKFEAAVTGNFNKVYYKVDEGIYLVSNGITTVFETAIYTERHYQSDLAENKREFKIKGYAVSRIQDGFNNTITYAHSDATQETIDTRKFMYASAYKWLDESGFSGDYTKEASVTPKKLSKITDTFGRDVNFDYSGDRISAIRYIGGNGNEIKIQYAYDENGNMTSVKTGSLPEKQYAYWLHELKWKHETIYTDAPSDWFKGYVIESITTPLGEKIEYAYQTGLTGQAISVDYEEVKTHVKGVLVFASSPVVTKKVVNEGNNKRIFVMAYPLKQYFANTIYAVSFPNKTYFQPTSDTDPNAKSYYFATATVDNPIQIQDEIHEFQNGLPIKKMQGIHETTTEWDFVKNVPTKVTQKKNGAVQTEQLTEYGAYNNPTRVTLKKAGANFSIQDTTYYSDTGYTNQNLLRLVQMSKATDVATGISRASYMTYTAQGKPFESYEGPDTSGRKLKTLSYDGQGRVSSETSYGPGGNPVVNYSYVQTATQYIVTQTLNGKSSEQTYELNAGNLVKSKNANNQNTLYAYDDYGRQTTTTYPDGTTDTISYSSDLKTTTAMSGGRTVAKTVDSLGRTVLEDFPAGEEDVKYDYYFGGTVGRISKQINGIWAVKKWYAYDSYLRKTHAVNMDFGRTIFTYNDANNTVIVTDPLGRTSQQNADELGRTITSTDTANGITSFIYNAFGETLTITDPRKLTHKTDYDNFGRINATYHTNTNVVRSIPTYDKGAIISTQINDKSGSPFRAYGYGYDTEGRLKTTSLAGTVRETLTYDESSRENGNGQLTSAETPDAISRYDYDAMGRIKKETTVLKPYNTKTYVVETQYNATNGNVSATIFPDGKTIAYAYDTNQRVNAISYDARSIAGYEYNANGTIKKITLGNGFTIDYSYAKDVLLSQILVKDTAGATFYKQDYTYDGVGRMTTNRHWDYFNRNGHPDVQWGYSYTNKDELKTVTVANQVNYTHNYDANGNHTRFETRNNRTLGGDNITIDPNTDQITEKRQNDGRKITFSYDAEGNMTDKTRRQNNGNPAAYSLHYDYNYQGQLLTAAMDGVTKGQFYYNHKRQRVMANTADKTEGQGIKWYYWDASDRIIGEGHEKNGDYVNRYIYSGNEKIAVIKRNSKTGSDDIHYFINNGQGTPLMIIDETGKINSTIDLDDWGNIRTLKGSKTEVNYTGKKLDPVTELYYFNQRYFDPEIARFLTEDPAAQVLNLYLYAGNNPLMYVDPDGEFWFLAPLLGAIVQGAIYGAASGAVIGATVGGVSAAFNSQNIFQGAWAGASQGAISGAISGGIAGGIGNIFGNAIDGVSNWAGNQGGLGNSTMTSLITDGVRSGVYSLGEGIVSGRHMSFENAWGDFSGAFGNGSLQSGAEMLYKNQVGFDPDWDSGEGYAGDGKIRERTSNESFVGQRENSIGIPVKNGQKHPIFPEGGPLSSVLNSVPGQNAHAKLHDSWSTNGILAVLSTPATLHITYSALINRQRRTR